MGSILGAFLQGEGFQVKLLQSHNLDTESPAYPSVVGEANHWLADIFISIHVNAGGGRGAETYCYDRHGADGRLAACSDIWWRPSPPSFRLTVTGA